MMIESRRNRILLSFALAYLVFAGLLIFLLLFNVGLKFENVVQGNQKITALTNNSIHLIENISIGYLDSNGNFIELQQVKKLVPGEYVALPYAKQGVVNGIITFQAMAPHHLTATQKVSEVIKINYELTVPTRAFAESGFGAELLVCNTGAVPLQGIQLSVEADPDFIEFDPVTGAFSLDVENCQSIPMRFFAKKAGSTKLIFNLKSDSFNESVEKEINIQKTE